MTTFISRSFYRVASFFRQIVSNGQKVLNIKWSQKRGSVLRRFISSCMHYWWTQVLSKFKYMLWYMYILAFPTRWIMTKRRSVTVPVNFTQAFASDNFYWQMFVHTEQNWSRKFFFNVCCQSLWKFCIECEINKLICNDALSLVAFA